MASTAQQIVDALDALILAKMTGATSVDDLTDRTLGAVNVSMASSLSTLTNLREQWSRIASSDDDIPGEVQTRVFPL